MLLDFLLPIARGLAEKLAGSGLADEALSDVRTLEGIAADHESAIKAFADSHLQEVETKAADWLNARLQRYLPVPAVPEAAPVEVLAAPEVPAS